MMKRSLRNEIALLKDTYTEEDLYNFSTQIFQRLTETEEFKKASCILAYYSFYQEVYTHEFIEKYAKEKKIILPVVQKDILVLKEYTGKDQMRLSKYGILEPTGPDFTDYSQIDLGVIPGMVFDRNLNRLGRGKAYYDKLLPLLDNAYLIGVCFAFQLKDEIPVESHDFPMNSIILPNQIIV
ncbi:MAG: 5-formyltetrahydrofolate cyclo-ligase [Bacteroidales bacterium]|jgi:5-formyltetrahydrofolate cyclo-ligase|nr:5-formyltetrahydrofolate cyclo-ligase [Bacteroidales bacterium]